MTSIAKMVQLTGAGALAVMPLWTTPPAAAVTPPVVDMSTLPKPGSPAPPQPTEQLGQCFAAGNQTVEAADDPVERYGLQDVWSLTRGTGQTVAVIDTGVSRHRLLPHLVPGGDYVSTGDGTADCDGHGTVVAGIIGASPDRGHTLTGIAPDATIIGIRQSSNKFRAADDPSGSGVGDVETLATAIRTAADIGATVINMSTVACLSVKDELDDRALGAALAYAVDVKNAVVVTAAGNLASAGQCAEQNPTTGKPNWSDVNTVVTPGWYDDYVLTVGSIGKDGVPSPFSLAGPWVDVAAVAEGVVSLNPDGEGWIDSLETADETPISGTSYAAPVVSAVAALVRSRSPELTARQVMKRIEDTAHRPPAGWDPVVGHGTVDAFAAVSAGPGSAPGNGGETLRPLQIPDSAPVSQGGKFAVRGAALCVAVSLALVAATTSANRLRRRTDAVPSD
ncbi:type VII secretion-associated serine protease mycosin [Mycolicibacterium rhodesiae NBB3]|uniref:Type VII secretion-associated serine protease mycosin n=1 Tax=Mycolicibacterium rhodesiae (strain NBB3) TaxID=710685 RepID=G8RNC2_MYCRN|nr:type VII secretion-associated serine protease mycosin [Mycolicibacterium rhodesiae]AEV71254.1 type VII secretion-associated serine protease mycosin [Mycolicibacterium rhodesiae NBB3]